ncbi:MAG: hypothetical protein NBV65_03045 [Burkholderiaceae bacterium]|nr:hypothetical protein [Burkholderiaceae bacterium]
MGTIRPFANESDSVGIDELTVENRVDQLEIYGSLSITRDKAGLERALQLKDILDAAVKALQDDAALPDRMAFKPTDKVDNPFK